MLLPRIATQRVLALIACTSLLAGVARAQTPQLVNGSFESPVVSSTTPLNTVPSGWENISFFSSAGRLLVPNSDPNARDTTFGDQRMMLGDGIAIQQTVAGFVAGTVYALSFYAATVGPGHVFGGEPLLIALLGASTLARTYVLPPEAAGPNNTVLFTYYEFLFVPAVDGAITFQLGNRFPNPAAASLGVTIDNVSIRHVPEHGSTAFLLTAACFALLLVRSRSLELRRPARSERLFATITRCPFALERAGA